MENITANLHEAMAGGAPDDEHSIIVTTDGNYPEGFGLKNIGGLTGLYQGKLTPAEIENLSQHTAIEAIDLDNENSIS